MTSSTAQLTSDNKKAAIAGMELAVARAQAYDEEAGAALRSKIDTAVSNLPSGKCGRCGMKISDQGLDLLIRREGKRNDAYLDTADPPVWTIGVGHTGPEVHAGLHWSDEQVAEALRNDLAWVEAAIAESVKVDIPQYSHDALASFTFNVGAAGEEHSTVVRRINAGDMDGAAAAFDMWHIPPSIISRRNGEREQFKGAAFEPTIP